MNRVVVVLSAALISIKHSMQHNSKLPGIVDVLRYVAPTFRFESGFFGDMLKLVGWIAAMQLASYTPSPYITQGATSSGTFPSVRLLIT
jgi:hypothetical protein